QVSREERDLIGNSPLEPLANVDVEVSDRVAPHLRAALLRQLAGDLRRREIVTVGDADEPWARQLRAVQEGPVSRHPQHHARGALVAPACALAQDREIAGL